MKTLQRYHWHSRSSSNPLYDILYFCHLFIRSHPTTTTTTSSTVTSEFVVHPCPSHSASVSTRTLNISCNSVYNQDTIVMVVFVFMIVITILSILLLVSVRVNSRNDRLARPSWFSIYPRSKESPEDDLTIFISPSRPALVGRTSAKGGPVMHITVTPPTPARLPSGRTHYR